MDVEPGTVHKLESGQRKITTIWMERFGAAFEVDPLEIISKPLRRVRVLGWLEHEYGAGSWEWSEAKQYEVAVPESVHPTGQTLYAGETNGYGMREAYPEGTILIIRPVDRGHSMISGKRYHVIGRRPDGTSRSMVLKFVTDEDGRPWLKPESNHPACQQWTPLDGGSEFASVEVKGLVTYALVPQ